MNTSYLSTKDVAHEVGVHRDTLLRWLRMGKVPEPARDNNGWRKFKSSELEKIKSLVGIEDAFISSENTSVRATAASLEKLDWNFANSKTGYLTHNIHPYPAKFIPQIPNQLIQELSSVGDTVLDPFCGSGTTLLEALLLRRNVIGIDANPLACLIARAKTARLNDSEFSELEEFISKIQRAEKLVNTGKSLFRKKDEYLAYAKSFDKSDLDFWFTKEVQQELAWIKMRMQDLKSAQSRDVAAAVFSAIIVNVSRQDSDTRYTRREKEVRSGQVLTKYTDLLFKQLAHLKELAELIQPELSREVICSDVLKTPSLPKVKLIVTSPPYPNAYSYHLYHRTRMLWLDMDQTTFKQEEIGSHRKYSSKSMNAANSETFRSELAIILKWLNEHLEPGGHICFLLGDSKIRGEIIKNDILFIEVAAGLGLELVSNIRRELQSTKKSFNPAVGRIRQENVIILRKEI